MTGLSSNKSYGNKFVFTREMNDQSVRGNDLSKKKNRIFRWNLLWAILVFGAIVGLGLGPLWLYKLVGCQTSWYVTATLFTLMDAVFVISALLAWPSLWAEWYTYKNTQYELRHLPKCTELTPTGQHINRHLKSVTLSCGDDSTDVESGGQRALPKLAHLVIMVGFKEPVDLICKTVDTIAAQTHAKSIIMVIGLEERTPDYLAKIEYFTNRYRNSFFRLIHTVHPFGLPGEVAGTCSNVNWAIRQSTTQLRDEGLPLDPEMTLVTKMDTDAGFLPNHFEILEREFLKLPRQQRLECTFQSPLIYNLGLDQLWFFTRITGILRTYFMLGFLIPHSINTMSIYHLSLHLARQSNYWIPNYQMEDIIQNLNFMVGIGKQVAIHLLPIPVVSGPTSGATLGEEFYEWRMQARRWTIGAAEVFHYFCIKGLGGNFDLWSGITYGSSFILYYGGILCVTGLYQVAVVLATMLHSSSSCGQQQQDGISDESSTSSSSLLFPTLLAIKYIVVFGTAYFADYLHKKIAGIEEHGLEGPVGWVRSVFHFLSTIFVLLAYNTVEAVAILEMCYRGRDVCGHIPANKAVLMDKSKKSNLMDSTQESTFNDSLVSHMVGPGVRRRVGRRPKHHQELLGPELEDEEDPEEEMLVSLKSKSYHCIDQHHSLHHIHTQSGSDLGLGKSKSYHYGRNPLLGGDTSTLQSRSLHTTNLDLPGLMPFTSRSEAAAFLARSDALTSDDDSFSGDEDTFHGSFVTNASDDTFNVASLFSDEDDNGDWGTSTICNSRGVTEGAAAGAPAQSESDGPKGRYPGFLQATVTGWVRHLHSELQSDGARTARYSHRSSF